MEVNNIINEALIKLHQHIVDLYSELVVEEREGKRYQLKLQIDGAEAVTRLLRAHL